MLVGYPDREPGSVVTAAVARVPLDSLLAGGDGVPYPAEKPKSKTEALERVGRLLVSERGLEGCPSLLPMGRLERVPSLIESAARRHVHRRRLRVIRRSASSDRDGDLASSPAFCRASVKCAHARAGGFPRVLCALA
jgi:hypothetical protein